ncbi:helix-turn-helix domain-containing protein [Millisia brevis]|uniref:helix-turn-helix domain-containing protein n=1 Tax=Millisia brevis TaxID=264148 RepID=UPI000A9A9F28|nr:helix-turn-helix domain-containing protein [Millisia brevis]
MQIDLAREEFFSGGEPTGVSADVLASWRRSKWSGLEPEQVNHRVVDICRDTPFTRAAADPMLAFAGSVSTPFTCLALADPGGNIVWRWVSERVLGSVLDDLWLFEGSSFEEELVGTNGVGTALETRRPAVVIGAEHYLHLWRDWACVAAPVFHPVTRRTCGAVNITCRAGDATTLLRGVIDMLAANVQQALDADSSVSERRLLDAFLARRRRTRDPMIAVNERLVIGDGDTAEHAYLWNAIRAADPAAGRIDLPDGRQARMWPVTEGMVDDGAVLAFPPATTPLPELPAASSPAASPAPAGPMTAGVPTAAPDNLRLTPLERAEYTTIESALVTHGRNKSKTADYLGISRRSLYDKLHRYRLG